VRRLLGGLGPEGAAVGLADAQALALHIKAHQGVLPHQSCRTGEGACHFAFPENDGKNKNKQPIIQFKKYKKIQGSHIKALLGHRVLRFALFLCMPGIPIGICIATGTGSGIVSAHRSARNSVAFIGPKDTKGSAEGVNAGIRVQHNFLLDAL
jgi:hypothetical protein